MSTRDSRSISEETVLISYRQGNHRDTRGTELGHCLRGRRDTATRHRAQPQSVSWGSRGKGCFWEGVRHPSSPRRGWQLAGSLWVDHKAVRALRTRTQSGAGVPTVDPLWQTYGCSTAFAPRRGCSRWSCSARAEARAGEPDRGAGPCTRQRAHAERLRPACALVPGDWRLDNGGGRARNVIGYKPQSLNEPGRGGASPGRDTTAKIFQCRQTPSLACFVLFTRFRWLLLSKLRVHEMLSAVTTDRSLTLGWKKAFHSCRPWLQIFQISLAK